MSLYDIVKSYDGALDLVGTGLRRKSAQAVFFLFLKSAFRRFFLFPEGKRNWKKIGKGIWGFFPPEEIISKSQ